MPPQPPRALSIRGLRLHFPELEPWVVRSSSLPAICPCANVGLQGATRCSACPVLSHSESLALLVYLRECGAAGSASARTACAICPTLRQSQSCHGNVSPLRPGCPSPPLLPVWMKFIFYFLGVGLPCRSIFCQFWLCEEAQCVHLRRHLGSPSYPLILNDSFAG